MESEVGKTSTKKAIDEITGVYTIKPVRLTYLREVDKNHNGAVLFDRAVISYSAERHPKTGLVNTGLTDQEARELEIEMHYKVGALSPYNMKEPERNSGDFSWATFTIKIPKEGLVIDAGRSAREKLMYKVLAAGSRVATSTMDLAVNPVKYDLVMTSSEVEAKSLKDKTAIKRKAYSELSKMSITDQMDFLSVYDEGRHKVSKDATPDFIEAEVGKIVDGFPEKFIETLASDHYKTMIFLFKCINAQLIYKQGPKYILSAGGDILGNSLLEAVTNLKSDDYQPVKISLLSKLETR
jgi:hypothetical protein